MLLELSPLRKISIQGRLGGLMLIIKEGMLKTMIF